MRVIPKSIPTFAELKLPPQLADIANLKNGIVLITGPTGSGKSSTMAAVLDRINETKAYHIITIEDPVEFMHRHKRSIIHQRELHSDTPSFALALRAALRQAPKVILVGEMRDKETIEIALEAAETGHLVLSTLHTIDASKTVERVVGVFPMAEQHVIRNRLAKSFRYIISQRLLPAKDSKSRVAVLEILKATVRTREYLEKGEHEGKTLLDAMRAFRWEHRAVDSCRGHRIGDRSGLCHQSRQFTIANSRYRGRTATRGRKASASVQFGSRARTGYRITLARVPHFSESGCI
jgi:twitching motility protein PilT